MVHAARDHFIAQGYATTTMEQIAATAGVAVQTVYYTFKTKGQLLCEVVEVTAAGEDEPTPVIQRPWVLTMLSETSPQRVLALCVEHGTAIFDRAAPLWPAVGAAAEADPYVEQYWRDVAAKRRAGQARMVGRLAEIGALRSDLDSQRATDVVVVLVSHQVFRELVHDSGWTVRDYKAWLFKTLVQQLLTRTRLDARALSDLSFAQHLT
jgi:TetR/AcrR family transcriptional regulator, regulator of autoinduction and epiphytic fitness